MSESYHAVCPRCATTNRLPRDKPAAAAKCGKCGAPMFTGEPLALTGETFARHLQHDDIPLVVDFWAEWCGPCRMMAPAFAQAARDIEPRARFAKVDTEAEQAIAARLGIRSIPTLMIFKNGHEVARQAGAMPAEHLKAWIGQYL